MPAPLDPTKLDHAIELYLAGEPVQEISATTGISTNRIDRERRTRGIPSRKFRDLPIEDIVAAYQAGASELALSNQYGVSRGAISKRLIKAGVQRRGSSEAGTIRASRMTTGERKAQAAAANRMARMRRTPQIQKHRHALNIELAGLSDSTGEARLKALLAERELGVVSQRAIGVYNVDLAAIPVAVEVLGGGWHSIKATHSERTPYILDEGWHLVMVWDYEGRSALGPGAADYIITFVEQIRRNPPATCQYRVVAGQGELLASCGREDDEFPLVPPPRGSLEART